MEQIIIAILRAGAGHTTVIAVNAVNCTSIVFLVALKELVVIYNN